MQKNIFSSFLSKELSRKEFLIYLGLGILAISGISGLIKRISDPDSFNLRKKTSQGFGSEAYGGKEKV